MCWEGDCGNHLHLPVIELGRGDCLYRLLSYKRLCCAAASAGILRSCAVDRRFSLLC